MTLDQKNRAFFFFGRILAVLLAAALLIPAFPAGAEAEEERAFVATADWEPPVINEQEALLYEPWLLVLKVAQGELGYVEGPYPDETKYGEWFGDKYTAWCSEFLTWCVHEADERYGTDLMNTIYPYYGHPEEGAPWFLQRERFVTSGTKVPVTNEKMWLSGSDKYLKNKGYIPYPGDYMWFAYYSPQKGTDHVAIVEGVSQEPDGSYLVHVIEGNNPDKIKPDMVQRNTYDQTWMFIYGYGTPVRRANRVVKIWNRGNDCYPIQLYLCELGYLKEKEVTAQLQEPGRKAINKYQKEHGLDTTGAVDLATRTEMEKDPRFLEIMAEYQQ